MLYDNSVLVTTWATQKLLVLYMQFLQILYCSHKVWLQNMAKKLRRKALF